jgi:soluble lytic murein transglycosylase-like protein
MPNQAYLEIIHPNGDVEFYPLDPGKGLTTIGRHADNDVVIDQPGVEPFHAVLDYRRSPCQIIVLSAGEGDSSPAGDSSILYPWDAFEIAGHQLILFDGEPGVAVVRSDASAASGIVGQDPQGCAHPLESAPASRPSPVPARPRRLLPVRFRFALPIGPGLTALAVIGAIILIGLMIQQIASQASPDGWQAQGGETRQAASLSAGARRSAAGATPAAQAKTAGHQVNEGVMSYEAMFKEVAQDYDLDWCMLAEQAYRESRLDPLALGGKREIGLMQIMPATWDEWAPKVGATDPWDPYSNVLVAAAYLDYLKGYCSDIGYPGDECMLVAYNWGPHNLHELVDNGEDWGQVPAKVRHYAYGILQATEVEATNHLTGLSTISRQVAVVR